MCLADFALCALLMSRHVSPASVLSGRVMRVGQNAWRNSFPAGSKGNAMHTVLIMDTDYAVPKKLQHFMHSYMQLANF